MLVLADDMNKNTIGIYGNKDAKTPNIDLLASQGMLFNSCYTATAMCAPTRTLLYTGLYPIRSGVYANHNSVEDGTKSIAHYLKDLGYRVGINGKRHVGPGDAFPFESLGDNRQSNYIDGPKKLVVDAAAQGVPW